MGLINDFKVKFSYYERSSGFNVLDVLMEFKSHFRKCLVAFS